MKKSRPVLFPEFIGFEDMATKVDINWQDIRPNHKLKIGRPSNRYYQYLYPSLNFKEHSLDNFNELLEFEGVEVYVRSVLKMKNGEFFAVLVRTGNTSFSENIVNIYAELKNSYSLNELLEL